MKAETFFYLFLILALLYYNLFVFNFSSFEKDPELYPNVEKVQEVNNYYNTRVSSHGSWKFLCDKYQKETNTSFNCFVEKKRWWIIGDFAR